VRRFVDWYIGDDGYPIKERSGVLRWFVRLGDVLLWGDSREELIAKAGKDALPKSFTFIPAKLSDNQILMRKDPSYLASLKALQRVDRLRLEGGNWNVRATAGSIFRREWFPIIPAIPNGWTQAIRFWDRASTTPNENNKDPDWTRGLKLLKYPGPAGSPPWYLVADIKSMRGTPGQVEAFIRQVANHDTNRVRIMSQCDPGSAGKSEAEHFVKMLQGFNVRTEILTANKVTRAKPVSAQAEVGNIKVLRSTWNDDFFTEVENFEENCKSHDDQVDTLSGAFNNLCGGSSILNAL
jgi:predicted phage terminase large subunit-like protein